ncbi:MAG: enoyl-CoA hydratase/isomerase family protein [Phycisphaeraceae bacterium]|nr:MAG: enoyl-CoA hydratase/isomerase family protein [Phycisphaeraceae bacterium]
MIRFEDQAGLRVVTLDRPDKRNALTPDMLCDLYGAFMFRGDAQSAVRAVLLRGEGPVFCSGFDLDLCQDDGPEQQMMRTFLISLSEVVKQMRRSPVPVVLAAHGAAIAGGCALLGGADVVVAERGAKLGYPVVRLGISPAVSAPFLLDAVGPGPARRRLLDPTLFDGAEGARIGLVHELVEERGEVAPRAHEIARDLASKPPLAMKATKKWVLEVAGEAKMEGRAARALDASVSLVAGDEAIERLQGLWKTR